MQFEYSTGQPQNISADTLVLFTPQVSGISDRLLKDLDKGKDGALSFLIKEGEFTGKANQIAGFYKPAGFKASRVLLVGLGVKKKINHDSLRRAAGTVARNESINKSNTVAFYIDSFRDERFYQAAAEGFLLGGFKMLEYKSKKDENQTSRVKKVTFVVSERKQLSKMQKSAERGRIIAEAQILARRLSFTPANDLTPTILAQKAQELARQNKIKCTILERDAIKKERMGALLAVSQGSIEHPRFIILEYKGATAKRPPIVLVGKGVTFDAGGISIKPAADMHEMKGDMTGAAVMLGTIVCAAKLKLPLNIVTLIPSTENMPSGNAYKPGDIIKTRKGLTVEIINTDAEGRLILADALDYANNYKPEAVIDIATLTGGALYVLGYAGAPIVANNKKLADALRKAADNSAERVWEMPLWDDFREAMKSPIADLWNSGGRTAPTLTASAFLENFIGDYNWAHIDIAYMDLEKSGQPYIPKGPTGFGVRLLIELLSNWSKL
ncbi:MAG: leucyl aminopeptidase [Candidatus Zixiibacteriota bacterium]